MQSENLIKCSHRTLPVFSRNRRLVLQFRVCRRKRRTARSVRVGTQNALIASERSKDLPKAGVTRARDSEDCPNI
jgi:hypothetical protein